MLPRYSCKLLCWILFVGLLLSACAPAPQPVQKKVEENPLLTQIARANEEQPFDVAELSSVLYLVVEMEVTAGDARPLGVSIIRGPQKANSALADLQVRARAGDKVVAEYTAPDPRIIESEDGSQNILDSATALFYAPLSTELSELQVMPAAGKEEVASKGSVLDLRPWKRRACESETGLDICKEILEKGSQVRVLLGGEFFRNEAAQQAIMQGVPWAELAKEFFADQDTPIPVEIWREAAIQKDVREIPYDPEKAFNILRELEAGQNTFFIIYDEEDKPISAFAQSVVSRLEKLEIKSRLIPVTLSEAPYVMEKQVSAGAPVIWLTW